MTTLHELRLSMYKDEVQEYKDAMIEIIDDMDPEVRAFRRLSQTCIICGQTPHTPYCQAIRLCEAPLVSTERPITEQMIRDLPVPPQATEVVESLFGNMSWLK